MFRSFVGVGASRLSATRGSVDFAFRSGVLVRKSINGTQLSG